MRTGKLFMVFFHFSNWTISRTDWICSTKLPMSCTSSSMSWSDSCWVFKIFCETAYQWLYYWGETKTNIDAIDAAYNNLRSFMQLLWLRCNAWMKAAVGVPDWQLYQLRTLSRIPDCLICRPKTVRLFGQCIWSTFMGLRCKNFSIWTIGWIVMKAVYLYLEPQLYSFTFIIGVNIKALCDSMSGVEERMKMLISCTDKSRCFQISSKAMSLVAIPLFCRSERMEWLLFIWIVRVAPSCRCLHLLWIGNAVYSCKEDGRWHVSLQVWAKTQQ